MRFITFSSIEMSSTDMARHFWGHPRGKIRTGLVLTKTSSAVLANAVVLRRVFGIVSLFAVTTKIAAIQETGDGSDAMNDFPFLTR